MTVANSVIKKTAKNALSDNKINSFVAGIVILVVYFINQNICSCLSLVTGNAVASFVLAVLNLILLAPIILGVIRYFWRMLCGVSDNPVSVFYYFSSKEKYIKSLNLTVKLLIKFAVFLLIFNIPYLAVEVISDVGVYEAFNLQVPLWTANLSNISVFLNSIGTVATLWAMLKYYLAPMLVVADEDMEVNEAIHMSVVISKNTIIDFIFLIFGVLGWILISFFLLPLIFLIPYFIMVYLSFCSFAVGDYNEHIKKINNNIPTFVAGI